HSIVMIDDYFVPIAPGITRLRHNAMICRSNGAGVRSGNIDSFMHPAPTLTDMARYISTIDRPAYIISTMGGSLLHAFTDIFFLGLLYNMIMGRGRGHLRAFTDNFFLGLLYNMIIFYLFMHLLAVFLPDGVRYFFFSIFSFLGYFFFPFMEFIRFFYLCLKWNFQDRKSVV